MIANIPYAQRGTKGPLAAAVQAALCECWCNLDIDGDFGPLTEKALLDFQQLNDLEVDGIAGPATYAKLFGGYTTNE
jgi:peptidoglycan hydrolase-like protein with peptidoglycan-binding domain